MDCHTVDLSLRQSRWRSLAQQGSCRLESKRNQGPSQSRNERELALRQLLSKLRNMSPAERARVLRDQGESPVHQDEKDEEENAA